ncbi:GNAT family N-acetyltransferase [Spiroplasma tabanidicola]|uniref:Acetyltransferase n=1 Tax=Spiroplasma tabanidicola TaxID=324079 RepID=A0A6I6CA08_9MOLU|nr:GNAT family N-acetyltransferase [Spiroplasma tabanidicola]QGS52289.1 acetyltransferase [Spiroplasma tabanidicola]
MEGIDFGKVFGIGSKLSYDALLIRKSVFVNEQNVPIEEELDDYDMESYHFVGYLISQPICCARLYMKDNKWYLGRVAVIKDYRGKNVGEKLVKHIVSFAKNELETSEIHISSQVNAIYFYKKFNFVEYGDKYVDAGIEHISMKLNLE